MKRSGVVVSSTNVLDNAEFERLKQVLQQSEGTLMFLLDKYSDDEETLVALGEKTGSLLECVKRYSEEGFYMLARDEDGVYILSSNKKFNQIVLPYIKADTYKLSVCLVGEKLNRICRLHLEELKPKEKWYERCLRWCKDKFKRRK